MASDLAEDDIDLESITK